MNRTSSKLRAWRSPSPLGRNTCDAFRGSSPLFSRAQSSFCSSNCNQDSIQSVVVMMPRGNTYNSDAFRVICGRDGQLQSGKRHRRQSSPAIPKKTITLHVLKRLQAFQSAASRANIALTVRSSRLGAESWPALSSAPPRAFLCALPDG